MPIFKNFSNKKDREFILEDAKIKTKSSVSEDAQEYILKTLKERGQMEVAELDELAQVEGISKSTLKEAKAELSRQNLTHTRSVGFKPKKYYITLKGTENNREYDKKP